MTNTVSELKQLLAETFPHKYVDQESFWNRSSLEGDRVRQFFQGKSWAEISAQSLRSGYRGDPSACLSFMSVQGALYYLPAYLSIVIEDYWGADMISESLMYEFANILPSNSSVMDALQLLGADQQATVTSCLRYVANTYEPNGSGLAHDALKSWERRDQSTSIARRSE